MSEELIVIGGGAAGFFCAVNAARMQPGLQVTILEKTSKLLAKVRISGGGRCNVTHACFDIAEMSKKYPRGGNFVKKTFHQFFTSDTIQWFEERGVVLKKEEDGRMFPVTDSSQTIVDCLIKEADKYDVKIILHADVKSIKRTDEKFTITLADQRILKAGTVCIACGGYPKTSMFEWLTNTGHSIENPVPSLFTFNIPDHPITKLMGVSVPVAKVKIAGTKLEQEGPVLITHWGLSGPAILRMSAWGARAFALHEYNFTAVINWVPDYTEQAVRDKFQALRFDNASQKLSSKNTFSLPQRLWEFFLAQSGIPTDMRWADMPAKEQNKLIKCLCGYEFAVKGKTTFKEEFVTAGGITLSEVDANTMMSKIIPHVFFAGEILNVDGITGGFNFQNAWTTGFIAAKNITAK